MGIYHAITLQCSLGTLVSKGGLLNTVGDIEYDNGLCRGCGLTAGNHAHSCPALSIHNTFTGILLDPGEGQQLAEEILAGVQHPVLEWVHSSIATNPCWRLKLHVGGCTSTIVRLQGNPVDSEWEVSCINIQVDPPADGPLQTQVAWVEAVVSAFGFSCPFPSFPGDV